MGGKPRTALEMLEASHTRVFERIEEIRTLSHELEDIPVQQAADKLETLCQYFEVSVIRHEEDEEVSIFPHLDAFDLTEELRLQHGEHRSAHHYLREEQKRLARGVQSRALPDTLLDIADHLEELYKKHIALEDEQLIPMVKKLPAATLDGIYAEMRARRGKTK